jgi:FtsH-binding integral membrane protein
VTVLIIAQLGVVLALSVRVNKMAASTAALLFVVYAALTGVTLSFLLSSTRASPSRRRSSSRPERSAC